MADEMMKDQIDVSQDEIRLIELFFSTAKLSQPRVLPGMYSNQSEEELSKAVVVSDYHENEALFLE